MNDYNYFFWEFSLSESQVSLKPYKAVEKYLGWKYIGIEYSINLWETVYHIEIFYFFRMIYSYENDVNIKILYHKWFTEFEL